MYRMVRLTVGLLFAGALPVHADVQDYCAAAARDFADLRPNDRTIWQQRYDGAEADCIEQFSAAPQVAAEMSKVRAKPVTTTEKPSRIKAAESAAKPKIKKENKKTEVATVTSTVEGAVTDEAAKALPTKPKLTVGSPEWLDYCSRKYTSFNREKGTYLSKTGVERKCLITADFR